MCQMRTQICSHIQKGTYVNALGQNKIYALSKVQRKVLAEKSNKQGIIHWIFQQTNRRNTQTEKGKAQTSYKIVRFQGGFVSRSDGNANLSFGIIIAEIEKEDF